MKRVVIEAGLPIKVVEGETERHLAFQDADVAIAASGTVALELAIVNVPHIIAYKVPKLTEWLARRFLHIQFVNLTNILLGREVVPELLQQDCQPDNIMQYVEKFLSQRQPFGRQMEGFEQVRQLLGMGEQTPSDNAAEAVLHLIRHNEDI